MRASDVAEFECREELTNLLRSTVLASSSDTTVKVQVPAYLSILDHLTRKKSHNDSEYI